jgi:phosphoenolpyruvate carboxykinase (ATP)
MTLSAIEKSLEKLGLKNLELVYWNTPSPALYEEAIRQREGHLSHKGPLVVQTGYFKGRAAKDKFIVDEPESSPHINWGAVPEQHFDALLHRVCSYLEGHQLFVQDCLAGADPAFEIPVRVITQDAWHALFARTMLVRPVDFGREIGVDEPQSCPGVPAGILNPEKTWSDGAAYQAKARELAAQFHKNFAKFADAVEASVRDAGPLHG